MATTDLPMSSTIAWCVLDTDGSFTADEHVPTGPNALDLRCAYRAMVLARCVDTEAIALQRQGELGLWPSMLGQEGAQVGAAFALRTQDVVFPAYREHAVAWCRGVDPVDLLGLFRGTTMGGWDPLDHAFNLYTLVVGAQTLHGVGYAMGIVRDGDVGTDDPNQERAVLVFLGDGALSQGETNEAFVWAAAQNLPVVFFCQNNQWAISAPYSVQSRVPAAERSRGFGFPGVRVDGNDVVACYAAVHEALGTARQGGGPTLIEAFTYRRNPHTTSDDDSRYRTAAENDTWAQQDPIERLGLHLGSKLDNEFRSALAAEKDELAERLRRECRELPAPESSSPFRHTLAEMPRELREQLEEYLASVDDREG